MYCLLLLGIIAQNPTIHVVVEKTQPRSQCVINDFNRDFMDINQKTQLTPRQLNTHHAHVRRLNRIRDSIRSSVVFVDSNDHAPLSEYPQYKVGKYGKWHKFPKQSFYSNGWSILTIARIIDEKDYDERVKKEEIDRSSVYYSEFLAWKEELIAYFKQKLLNEDDADLKAKMLLDKLDYFYPDCTYQYSDDGLSWYNSCCKDTTTNVLTEMCVKYCNDYPDMPYRTLFCPAITRKSYLPFEFDVFAHEGFKKKTDNAYGSDIE